VIGLRSWRIEAAQNRGQAVYFREADSAEQAIRALQELP
jgi:hypothetical protein